MIPEERARPLIKVVEALGDAIVKVIDFAMKLAPYGVFGLIFVVTSRFGWDLLGQLLKYVLVVLAGLFIYASVGLSALVRIFGGLSPRVFWQKAWTSVVTAFSTSSSNATLPTNIAVAEKELKIPPKIAGFVLPLGATMNMNGTALYEGVTVLFLAQVFGVDLSFGQQAVVVLLSVVTAIGAAGVPGGSLPLIMVVLATVGVRPEAIAIILGIDRILDMARTTLNVSGDLTAAAYVARTESDWDPRAVASEISCVASCTALTGASTGPSLRRARGTWAVNAARSATSKGEAGRSSPPAVAIGMGSVPGKWRARMPTSRASSAAASSTARCATASPSRAAFKTWGASAATWAGFAVAVQRITSSMCRSPSATRRRSSRVDDSSGSSVARAAAASARRPSQ
jgi:hypothetical protein